MALVKFNDLMENAERENYAVGYFESWNLESLLAVADAAEVTRSPVLLGFSGIYLTHPERVRRDSISIYAALGLEVCREISVPAALVFNECPDLELVLEAVNLGYSLVMFSDDALTLEEQIARVRQATKAAHQAGAAVEGEALALPGVGGDLLEKPERFPFTEVDTAQEFVQHTGVDAFAVNIGQVHLHGRQQVELDFMRLQELYTTLRVPLVLHGASSVRPDHLAQAVKYGIRKINVGSLLKQVYFENLRKSCCGTEQGYNPYEVIGSGLESDVLTTGRLALQVKVHELMELFGSCGKAESFL